MKVLKANMQVSAANSIDKVKHIFSLIVLNEDYFEILTGKQSNKDKYFKINKSINIQSKLINEYLQ